MNQKRRLAALMLVFSLVLSSFSLEATAKTVKPSVAKKLTVTVGTKKTLKIKNTATKKIKKTTWKASNNKIKLSKKKKNQVTFKGVKKGTAKLTVKVLLNTKKSYKFTCQVTIKAKKAVPVVTETPVQPTIAPTAEPTIKPTATPYVPSNLPEAAAVKVPEKPQVNASYTDEISSTSTYDLSEALGAESVKDAYSKYFKIGAAINGNTVEYSTAASPEMRQVMKHHFNSTTLSNLLKPQYLLDQSASQANSAAGKGDTPALNFEKIVDNMEFCKESGIKMRGHVLVWHAQTPNWFFHKGFTNEGALVDKATMQKRMGSYIRQVLEFCQTYYPGVIYCWDVVNEAVDPSQPNGYRDSNWYRTIGKGFVADAFYYARKYADQDVKLFYNDYNAFDAKKSKKILQITKPIKQAGLLDGIGMQSYLNSDWPDLSEVETAIRAYAAADMEIQLTELTYRVPDFKNVTEDDYVQQGKNYQALMNRLIALDTASGGPANITSVTFFGLVDDPYTVFNRVGNLDQDCWARLFDKNFKLKPAYYGVMNALTD